MWDKKLWHQDLRAHFSMHKYTVHMISGSPQNKNKLKL